MKQSRILFILLAALMSLSACNGGSKNDSPSGDEESSEKESSSEESMEELDSAEVTYQMTPMLDTTNPFKIYKLDFEYDSEYFGDDSTAFNKGLAMLSYGLSLSTAKESSVKKYLRDCGFKVIFTSENYDGSTNDGVSYMIGYRTVNGVPLLGVAVRGFNYNLEWADNFNVGLTGNHNGFDHAAKIIESSLDEIISTRKLSDYKLWVTGYSRGGAIANVLGANIMKNDGVSMKNIFIYTFEAPRGVAEENLGYFGSIHNIVNDADLIASILPAEHGLYRAGNDFNIFDPNYRELLMEFDSSISIPAVSSDYEDERDIKTAILDKLVKEQDEEYGLADMSTRENYYSNIQPHAMYLLDLFFKLKQSTINNIKAAFSSMQGFDMLGLIAEDGLYKFLEEDHSFISDDGVDFDTNELKDHLHFSSALILGPAAGVLSVYMLNSTDLTDLLDMHYPEINYVLLKNYELLGE